MDEITATKLVQAALDARRRAYAPYSGYHVGAAVLDAGLRRLHNNGINGCVIDWTDLVEFYGKFGFTPYRKYVQLVKAL